MRHREHALLENNHPRVEICCVSYLVAMHIVLLLCIVLNRRLEKACATMGSTTRTRIRRLISLRCTWHHTQLWVRCTMVT